MNIIRTLNELDRFMAEMSDGSFEHLTEMVQKEAKRRLSLKEIEPMLPEEKKLSKLEAIKAYKGRTGCALSVAIEAYSRK